MALTNLIPWRRSHGGRLDPLTRAETSLSAFQREMNRMFDEFWGNGGTRSLAMRPMEAPHLFVPTIELSEKDDTLTISAELPGMSEKEIDVALSPDGTQLTIQGEKRLERKREDENFYACERAYGAFRRGIDLPAAVDPNKVEASYRDGVLTVELHKSDEEGRQLKHIKIKKA